MLNKTVKHHKNNIAYKIKIDEDKYKTISYEDLGNMVNSLGTALIDLGLKDKRIAVIGSNSFEWELSYLSIICGVGVVVPIDKSLPEYELSKVLEKSEVEAIFCENSYIEIINNIKSNTKLKNIFPFNSIDELVNKGNELIKDGNKTYMEAEIKNREMSIMLFTSGTTSKSKVVALSHENICTNLIDLNKILDINSEDVFLSVLPVHHVFECTFGFLFPLYKGAQITFSSGLRHIPESLREYKVSVMACVPAIYESIYKTLSRQLEKEEIADKNEYIKSYFGGNVKLFVSGAAYLDPKVEENYRLLGINLMQGYGLTETSPFVSVGTNENYRLGSVGKCVPSVEARIVDINDDGIGELVVKGKNIMIGYYGDEDLTKESIKDDWFYTGDLARIDEDGYIFICGRKKNTIVLNNGKNVYPEEIENLVNKIVGVKESIIFGKEYDGIKDTKVSVKIIFDRKIMKNNYDIEDNDLIYKFLENEIKKINKIMPKYKNIRGIIISEDPLIKTSTNKLKRHENILAIKQSERGI